MEESPGARELVALLAEPDRLKALAAVALGAATLAEVAGRAELEPRAAARALSRLVAGGLLEGEAGKGYRVRTEALRAAARPAAAEAEGGHAETTAQVAESPGGGAYPGGGRRGSGSSTAPGRRGSGSSTAPGRRGPGSFTAPGSPQDAVLRRFIHNGRLLAIPAAHGKRLVVLDHLAGLFEPGRRYPEAEVNELLKRYHPDYALLRRCLVDDGFLDREDEPAPSGSHSVKVYWRAGGTVELD
jgi:hypothetical protein